MIVSLIPAGRSVSNFCRWMTFAALANRLVGQPPPAHLSVMFAPFGAVTVRRWIFAPPTVRTPLTRTTGKGRIIGGLRVSGALRTARTFGTAVGTGAAATSGVATGAGTGVGVA